MCFDDSNERDLALTKWIRSHDGVQIYYSNESNGESSSHNFKRERRPEIILKILFNLGLYLPKLPPYPIQH